MRRQARTSLKSFTEYTFPEFESAKHHTLLFQKLEEVEHKVRTKQGARLMVFMPPRHTKSEIVSRRFPAYLFGRNHNLQIIQATYSSDFACDFGRDVRGIVRSEEYTALFPHMHLRQDSMAANRWNTGDGGTFVASGVGGPLTGRGAHVAIIDDPYKNWQDANSETVRKSVWNWYLTVLRTRLMPGGAIIIVMTRWHGDDIAATLIEQEKTGDGEKWDIISLPGLAEKDDILGRQEGEALWPEWYSKKDLETTRRVMPAYEFSALYQQNPIPEVGIFFERAWFKEYTKVPKNLKIYICHDDAVTPDGGDFTEVGVFGIDHNDDIYILDWWRGQQSSDKWINVLLNLVKRNKPMELVGESGPIMKAVEPFIKKRMKTTKIYAKLRWLPSVANKSIRASAFRGLASMGKVYIPANKAWVPELINQLVSFPNGAHDDGVDVCSLLGRIIDKTITPIQKKKDKIPDMNAKPTLNQLMLDADKIKDNEYQRL